MVASVTWRRPGASSRRPRARHRSTFSESGTSIGIALGRCPVPAVRSADRGELDAPAAGTPRAGAGKWRTARDAASRAPSEESRRSQAKPQAPSTSTRTPMPSVSPSETDSTSPFFVATCWTRRVTPRASAYAAPEPSATSIACPHSSRKGQRRLRHQRGCLTGDRKGHPSGCPECAGEDLNLHGLFAHKALNLARLPIPPPAREANCSDLTPSAASRYLVSNRCSTSEEARCSASDSAEIFDFVVKYADKHGYPPTVREIGEAVGLASPSTVHAHLANLERAGYLRRDPTKPRALEVVGRGRRPAAAPAAAPARSSGRSASAAARRRDRRRRAAPGRAEHRGLPGRPRAAVPRRRGVPPAREGRDA